MPPTASPAGPLAGRTILEAARTDGSEVALRAIALAGRIAVDLGADVIKVEPPGGDVLRRTPPFIAGRDGEPVSATHVFLDRGKRSLVLGSSDNADAIIARLARRAQAVLTDRVQGVLGNGASVTVLLSHGLPASLGIPDARVTDRSILAASGILDLVGDLDAAPIALGGHQASYVAGLAAFSGLVAGLAAVDRGRRHETVRISALEACLWSNWKSFAERLYVGQSPRRQGPDAEWQILPCADGYATFIYLDKDWPAIVRLIGDERLGCPPLDTRAGRKQHMADVLAMVRPWYAARNRAEVFELAKAAGLPIGPVLGVPELARDAQYAALAFLAPPQGEGDDAPGRVPSLPTTWNGRRFRPRATSGTWLEGTP